MKTIPGMPPAGIDTHHPLDIEGEYAVAEYLGPRPYRVVFRPTNGHHLEITGGFEDRDEAEATRDLYQEEYEALRAWWLTLTTDADRAYARQRFGR